ncbi:MAG TPA: SGNH/GDSL hydrolase family protein [Nitrospira sp.]|nr:SGNH/GDSL hydrolase family protein [Nitrospira sp.]MBX7040335.1 SGNH/GDSL hydrolase family protein [Nitrospira sp.]MCW5792862.1 SGNH/GDSL hydrolase family protein [Nitrospira sp.]HMU30299.1 SGNH/GDSL hydrolase family protein [Nitrospira sp.]HMV56175.1 SGNH/GDSL hydrolase family protein [Nitrospira sp.]
MTHRMGKGSSPIGLKAFILFQIFRSFDKPLDMISLVSLPVALCGLAASFFSFIVIFYRLQHQGIDLWHAGGLLFIIAVFCLACISLSAHYRHTRRIASKAFTLQLTATGIALALLFLGAEVMIRVVAEQTPEETFVGDTVLLPREWQRVQAHRLADWERSRQQSTIIEPDATLGWTIGPNRKEIGIFGEMYFSNAYGLRTLANETDPKATAPALRIAISGNSYAYGLDVTYDETWGHQLESRIGQHVQVLNFGVPAYGLDQSYLRYLRDIQDWHPDIVILALISHDLVRSGLVYYLIGFQGGRVPGAKPRLSVVGEEPFALNLPLPSPERIYSTSSIEDLPFVDFDIAYRPADWKWHLYQYSYLLRFAVSWNPTSLWSPYELAPDVERVDKAILKSFVDTVRATGSTPLVVFLPEYGEFRHSVRSPSEQQLLGRRVLQEAGVKFLDLTACLELVNATSRFTLGWHYTAAANSAVAECLLDEVSRLVGVILEHKS